MAGEQIRITGGPAAGQQIEIGQELQIGRSAGTEGRLGDDPEISRQHARFSRTPQGQLVVEDGGSTNGTYVNGQRISGQQVLNPGDTVQMGRSTITVEGDAGGGQATAIGAVPTGMPGGGGPPPPPPAAAGPPTAQTQPLQAQGPGGPGPGGPGGPGYGGGPGGPGGPGYGGPGDQGGGGRNTGRIALIAGLIAAVVIGAVVLAQVLAGGGDDDKDTSTQASTAQNTSSFPSTTTTTSTPTTTEETTTEDTTTDETTEDNPLDDIPPATKKQFVKQCSSQGAPRSACKCAIDKIDDEYDFVEYIELLQRVQKTGKFPPKAQKLIQSCRGQ